MYFSADARQVDVAHAILTFVTEERIAVILVMTASDRP